MSRSARRWTAVLASAVLALGLVATGPSASAARKPVKPETSADWLADQLTNGVVHNDQFSFDDYGLTADVGFALAALEGHVATCARSARPCARR